MKKTHPSSYTSPSVQQLRQLFEQSVTNASASKTPHTVTAPKKPPRERTIGLSQTQSAKAAPPVPPRQKGKGLSQTAQQSQTQSAKTAPPVPPRQKDKGLSQTTQQSQTQSVKTAPQRPPRQKDKELSQTAQKNEAVYAKLIKRPPPTRTRNRRQSTPVDQQDKIIYATLASSEPSHAKDRGQGNEDNYATVHQRQSPPLPKKLSKTKQGNEDNYATVHQRQSPPLPKKLSKTKQGDEDYYATVHQRQSPPLPKKLSKTSQDEQLVSTPAASSRTHSRDTLNDRMQRSFLLEAYREEIRYWCQTVYKDRLVLEDILDDIQKNPEIGEQLSSRITKHPNFVAKLSGNKVLGIKTGARKEAEKNIPSLCAAIRGYTNTVKQIQDLAYTAGPEQKQQQQTSSREERVEILQKPLKPTEKKASLPSKDIFDKINHDPFVQYFKEEVRYWCRIVYGDQNILDQRLEEVQKIPNMGEELSWQVTNHPTIFSQLAGRKTLGVKTSARKQAEEGLSCLGTAITDYTDTVKQKKEEILQQQEQQPPARQSQDLQKQKAIASPKLSERSPENVPHEARESSRQAEKQSQKVQQQSVRPRKVTEIKTVALIH